MLLSKRQLREIERHFLSVEQDRANLKEIRQDLIGASRPANESGVHTTSPGDPTGRTVVALEARCRILEKWIKVVDSTYERFCAEEEGVLMRWIYGEPPDRRSVKQAARKMHISIRTAYSMRHDVLMWAAIEAEKMGIGVF